MATQNLTFTATTGTLYQLSPDARPLDMVDHLLDRLDQLCALLCAPMEGGLINVLGNDSLAMSYMRACQSLADECHELSGLLSDAYIREQCKLEGLAAVLCCAREQFVQETTPLVQASFFGACERMASECREAISAMPVARVAS